MFFAGGVVDYVVGVGSGSGAVHVRTSGYSLLESLGEDGDYGRWYRERGSDGGVRG